MTNSPMGLVLTAVVLVGFTDFAGVVADAGYGGYGAPVSQSHLIEELRHLVQGLKINPFFTTDRNLERMLVETGYRVHLAAKRLRRTALFRQRVKADHLLDWTPSEHFTSNLPYECSGYAKDGSPVFLFPFGQWNTPRLFRLARKREFYNYFLRMLEDARHNTKGRTNPKTGEPVDQAVFIVDAKGFSLRKLLTLRSTWTLLRIAYTIDRHYPFLVQKWYVVNAPLAYRALWKLVRLVSSPTLERAVKIFSAFTRTGHDALAHNILPDAIPVSLGGTYVPKYELNATPSPLLASVAAAWSNKVAGWPSTDEPVDTPWPGEKSGGYVSPAEQCITCTSSSQDSSQSAIQYGTPAEKTSDQYGLPSSRTPAQYDSPPVKTVSQYGPPSAKTSSEYGPPEKTPVQYGFPGAKASTQYSSLPAKVSSDYGPPPEKAPTQYGLPAAKVSTQYSSLPAKASSDYGPPPEKASSDYGPPPEKAPTQYGFPAAKVSTQYSSLPAQTSVQYGPAPEKAPSQYGLLEKTPAQYSLPLTKTSNYDNPSGKTWTQYGPPQAKTSPHYGTPGALGAPAVEYSAPSISAQEDTESLDLSDPTDFKNSPPKSLHLNENILTLPQDQYGSPEATQLQTPQLSSSWQYGKTFLASSGHL